jgi:Cdc6-like AAA superfamily ATPase
MHPALRDAFEAELRQAAAAERGGDATRAFRHLERAHVLSQRHTVAHVRAHLRMLG